MRYHVYEIVTATDDVLYVLLDEDDYFIVVGSYIDISRINEPYMLTKLQVKFGNCELVLHDDKSIECINMNVTLEEAVKIIEFNRLING